MDTDRIAQQTSQNGYQVLAKGYKQIADDPTRELEAEEWIEALIDDVTANERHGPQPAPWPEL